MSSETKKIRQAISFALNKQEITDKVFGETRGKIGDSGITHPYMPNYRKNGVELLTLNNILEINQCVEFG